MQALYFHFSLWTEASGVSDILYLEILWIKLWHFSFLVNLHIQFYVFLISIFNLVFSTMKFQFENGALHVSDSTELTVKVYSKAPLFSAYFFREFVCKQ